jgi:hypothetical protein
MARNRWQEYVATAPLWQMFLVSAVSFGLLTGLFGTGGTLSGFIAGLFSGIPFGAGMTAFVAWQRRRDRRTTGVASGGPLERAMRDGRLPVEPDEAQAMARLVARRRRQHRWSLVVNPPLMAALAALGIVYGILIRNWGFLALTVLLIGVGVYSTLTVRRRLHKLNGLAGRLPPAEDHSR